MAIRYLILLSRQGKVRLAKWFTTLSPKDKAKIIKDVSQLVLARRARMCNFLEYKGIAVTPRLIVAAHTCCAFEIFSPRPSDLLMATDTKVVYRRYASLFFIAATDPTDNELITLEIVHRYVEQMDKYYGNVCELDIIFNFQKAYFILDELLLAGEMQESSKKNVLRVIGAQDSLEDMEVGVATAMLHAAASHLHNIITMILILYHHPLMPYQYGDEQRTREAAQKCRTFIAA
ncbi:hypothetical protein AC579_8712 [Pseudocercospora musae]|uniref:AP complex mu/sigma subunit domain-containing protein n=1 Tax=Pseudocercospora musae TaxID=113226 RepID=A0A139IW50_9PEZI|nr:hypothetical protein AC579_8712 [Pseudocercospora musae]KXT18973.1 hypothetical protein AC579_8712 [Pseudocercospora musae]